MDHANIRTRELELRQACAKLEKGLRAGQAARAENFFRDYPLLTCQDDAALDLIYVEFITREELGQKPTPEEFYARFPQWKARLTRQFEIHDWLRDDKADGPPPDKLTRGNLHALDGYEILEEIGRGRFGVVYKAWQRGLDRLVAVKVPAPHIEMLVPSAQAFCNEARVMAGLQHPHIMPVHDIGAGDGLVYFSMDLAAGGSLAQLLADGAPLQPQRAVDIVLKVAEAVHYAHQKGVVHRDLKPSNILFDDQHRPLVTDFGLARLPGEPKKRKADDLLGTPAYAAPEQIGAKDGLFTPAVDIWALGVILHETLSGKRPFDRKTKKALFRAIARDTPPSLQRCVPAVDARLEEICRQCLAKEPAGRFATARDLAQALADWATRQ